MADGACSRGCSGWRTSRRSSGSSTTTAATSTRATCTRTRGCSARTASGPGAPAARSGRTRSRRCSRRTSAPTRRRRRRPRWHIVSNPMIDLDGDRATAQHDLGADPARARATRRRSPCSATTTTCSRARTAAGASSAAARTSTSPTTRSERRRRWLNRSRRESRAWRTSRRSGGCCSTTAATSTARTSAPTPTLFAAEGEFIAGPDGEIRAKGPEAIFALVDGMRGTLLTDAGGDDVHVAVNEVIELDGDRAHGHEHLGLPDPRRGRRARGLEDRPLRRRRHARGRPLEVPARATAPMDIPAL